MADDESVATIIAERRAERAAVRIADASFGWPPPLAR
jgi:hypothetical protein